MKIWQRTGIHPLYVKPNTSIIFKLDTDNKWYAHFLTENLTQVRVYVGDIAQIEQD
jgi:hypothetical protein